MVTVCGTLVRLSPKCLSGIMWARPFCPELMMHLVRSFVHPCTQNVISSGELGGLEVLPSKGFQATVRMLFDGSLSRKYQLLPLPLLIGSRSQKAPSSSPAVMASMMHCTPRPHPHSFRTRSRTIAGSSYGSSRCKFSAVLLTLFPAFATLHLGLV